MSCDAKHIKWRFIWTQNQKILVEIKTSNHKIRYFIFIHIYSKYPVFTIFNVKIWCHNVNNVKVI